MRFIPRPPKKIAKAHYILLAVFIGTSLSFTPVFAEDEGFYNRNDIQYYSTSAGICSNNTPQSPTSGAAVDAVLANANIQGNGAYSEGLYKRYTTAMDKLFIPQNIDFVTLQEIVNATDLSYKDFKSFRKNPVGAKRGEGGTLRIVWNATKWEKIAGDIVEVHPHNSDGIGSRNRYALWATFKNISPESNGAIVSVISTHWNVKSHENNNKAKLQAKNLITLVQELMPKGPVLIGGDFNYNYSNFDNEFSPKNTLGQAGLETVFGKGEGTYVDWIFHSSQLEAASKKVFELDGNYINVDGVRISDHPFTLAKFKGTSEGIGEGSGVVSSGTSCVCSAPSVGLTGSDNQEKAFNFFVSKGLSNIQSAGILGNIIQESGVDPENIQDPDGRTKDPTGITSGWGIIQWTPADPKVFNAQKESGASGEIYELGTQLEIVWGHLNNRPAITTGKFNLSDFQKIDNLEDAVLYFEEHIEGAGNPVLGNRITYAEKVLELYGKGTPSAVASSAPSGCGGEIGPGSGSFTDSGEVANWSTILNNAKMSEQAFGDSLVNSGRCAAIVSRVWRNANIGYGYDWAEHAFYQNPDIRHADRNPKLGSILIYGTEDDDKAGHVVIYLGNNKILNDGHIADANSVDGWGGGEYLGWIDPNELGWNTSTGTEESIRNAVNGGM
jgi:hypothetical protein